MGVYGPREIITDQEIYGISIKEVRAGTANGYGRNVVFWDDGRIEDEFLKENQ